MRKRFHGRGSQQKQVSQSWDGDGEDDTQGLAFMFGGV